MKHIRLLILILIMFCIHTQDLNAQYWKSATLPTNVTNNYWLDVYFLPGNTQLGWVCGFNAATVRTTDGGNTWIWSRVTQLQNPMLESIHFVSPQIGFTSGPQGIWRSNDGGATWFDISPPNLQGSLWGCYFKDQNLGLVVGGGCGGPQLYYRTTDGGSTWTLFQGNEPQSGMCDLILDKASDTGYASSSGVIWQTTNAGQTWNVFSRSNTINAWQEEIAWLGDSFLVPYSGSTCQGGGGGGGMCFSTNKGQTWNRVAAPDNLFGTYLTSATTGWACGYDRSVYYTSNAGRNWEMRNCGTTGSLDDLHMFSDTTGWVVGEGIYKLIPGYHEVLPKNPLIFSTTCVNSMKKDSILIRNVTFESTIVTLTLTGNAASDYIVPFTSFALGACEERMVPIFYRPTASGARNANLGISMINPLETFTVQLQGTASDITMDAGGRDTLSIGSHLVGSTSDSTFVVHNRSNVDITLSSIDPLDFPAGHTLLWNMSLPLRIPAKDSVLMRYRIIMKDTGRVIQRFQFRFGLCDKTIAFQSIGTAPKISSPESFTILADCKSIKDSAYIVSNMGTAPLIIHGLSLSGGDSTSFLIGSTILPMIIPPGNTGTIILRYIKRAPLDPDAKSRLLIYHSDTLLNRVSPRVVNLTGTRAYALAGPLNDSIWAGRHCLKDKGNASITLGLIGQGNTQVQKIISLSGRTTIVSPSVYPIAMSSTLSVNIQTTATVQGRYRDTLLILSGPCKDTIPMIVEGEAITTDIAFVDSILTGTIDQGMTEIMNWDLLSLGTALADIRRMRLVNNQEIRLTNPLPSPAIIDPGQKGIVSLTVKPTLKDTLLLDTLCIEAQKECPTTICIPIRITVRQARLALSDSTLSYAMRCDTTLQKDTVYISNPGLLNDTIQQINVLTNMGQAFSHTLGIALPYIMKPSDSIPIVFSFAPKSQGTYSYSLEIISSSSINTGKNQLISLSGTFAAPEIMVSPTLIDLGMHESCAKDSSIAIRVQNTGLENAIISMKNATSIFTFNDPIINILPMGDTIINVSYIPRNAPKGRWNDVLSFTDTICGRLLTIPVTGFMDTISIASNPPALDFGRIYRDDSLEQTIIITNTSQFSLHIDSIQLAMSISEYEIQPLQTLPLILKPKDTISIKAKAKAMIEGSFPKDSIIVYAHRDCAISLTIPLQFDIPKEAYTAILSTQDYDVQYGDTISIQCRLDGELTLARLRTLSFTLELDGNVFTVIDTKPKAIISHTDSSISWKINAKDIPLNGGVISEIMGRALVTRHRNTPLHFTSIVSETNRSITITQKDGSLTVSPTCGNSLTGFREMSVLSARVLPPHPIQSHISIAYHSTAKEQVHGTVTLYALHGSKLYESTIVANEEEQIFTIPETFPAGTYILEVHGKHILQRELILIAP
ncbi:MAG: WD40/YVTN/BNR-like repeat-containing protein [Candidatus Kapaibacteriota bacterium]